VQFLVSTVSVPTPEIASLVDQNLVDLRRVDSDRPQVSLRLPLDLHVFADEPAQHLEHLRDGVVQVQDSGRGALPAGKREQLARQLGRPHGRPADLLDARTERLIGVHLLDGQLRVSEDHAQHVVEVMGDPARQAAHRFHLLGLVEMGFERGLRLLRLDALGEVAR
jgi:hypothetical protein